VLAARDTFGHIEQQQRTNFVLKSAAAAARAEPAVSGRCAVDTTGRGRSCLFLARKSAAATPPSGPDEQTFDSSFPAGEKLPARFGPGRVFTWTSQGSSKPDGAIIGRRDEIATGTRGAGSYFGGGGGAAAQSSSIERRHPNERSPARSGRANSKQTPRLPPNAIIEHRRAGGRLRAAPLVSSGGRPPVGNWLIFIQSGAGTHLCQPSGGGGRPALTTGTIRAREDAGRARHDELHQTTADSNHATNRAQLP
jgi:hypothetical protein